MMEKREKQRESGPLLEKIMGEYLAQDIREFKAELKAGRISQRSFANNYCRTMAPRKVDDETLDKHFENFKKMINGKPPKNSTHFYSYLSFFKEKYKQDGKYTQDDHDAIYELIVELSNRIATVELDEGSGDEAAALYSLYEIFPLHRDISKKYGVNAKLYSHSVTQYLNEHLRPFTTKWHLALSENNKQEFRNELKIVQRALRQFKSTLFAIIEPQDRSE